MLRAIRHPANAIAAVLWVGSAWSTVAHAQPTSPAVRQDGPTFALRVGGESQPNFDGVCSANGRRTMGVLGASFIVPIGAFALEARAGAHGPGPRPCVSGLLIEPGTHTSTSSTVTDGGYPAVDLRARWLPSTGRSWYVAAGGGWAGSPKDVPYLNVGVGARSRFRSVRPGGEIELSLHRVPWTQRTVEIAQDGSATETARREYRAWSPSIGLVFTLEIPVVREP